MYNCVRAYEMHYLVILLKKLISVSYKMNKLLYIFYSNLYINNESAKLIHHLFCKALPTVTSR